jgi:hypothetical protein
MLRLVTSNGIRHQSAQTPMSAAINQAALLSAMLPLYIVATMLASCMAMDAANVLALQSMTTIFEKGSS